MDQKAVKKAFLKFEKVVLSFVHSSHATNLLPTRSFN